MGTRLASPYTDADDENTKRRTPSAVRAPSSESVEAVLFWWYFRGLATDSATSR